MDVFSALLKDVRESKAALSEAVLSGAAKSYDEYRELVGRYRSLDDVELSIREMEKRFIEE